MNKPIHAPSPAATGNASDLAAKIGFFLGPLLLLVCLVIDPPAGMSADALHVVGLALLMATWWSTEALPIPITSLLPILLVPALGIDSIGNATASTATRSSFSFWAGSCSGWPWSAGTCTNASPCAPC